MKYVIRRTLLQILHKFYCPQDLNTVMLDDRLQLLNADPAQVLREWQALTDAGYLLVVQGYPDYRSIERKTRVKLQNGETLLDDPFFAGPNAMR